MLGRVFGANSSNKFDFDRINYQSLSTGGIEEAFYEGLDKATAILESIRDEIMEFGLQNEGVIWASSETQALANTSRNIFVVHGHDEEMKHYIARILQKLDLVPIILHDQANSGKTVIEKFEAKASDVSFAIVLLSPDDLAHAANDATKLARHRARQNVILELGYFVGKLGRKRVFTLKRGDIEIPSDFAGVVYTTYDSAGNWRFELVRELKECGYSVDANQLI